MKNTVIYVHDKDLQKQCDRLPMFLNRASIVQDLINGYGLLSCENIKIMASKPATENELKSFHSSAYIDFLKKSNTTIDLHLFEEEQDEFGLSYDCPLLPRTYDLVQTIAGGSLTAAAKLASEECKIAINWFGGWHHAQRDEAEGFCYVNDVVLAIQKLTQAFSKILYIDLDIHHGNGVQNAFEFSKKVMTLSFHKVSPGFYPGTGTLDEIGSGRGKYHSLNVPFLEGCRDKTYLEYFTAVFPEVLAAFKPNVLVVQCGADILNGDPVGQANVTSKGIGFCLKEILKRGLPTLLLGGGGYNFSNAARHWVYLTALIVDVELSNDIPDECYYFTLYKPTYELHIDEGNQKDCNTKEYIAYVISTLTQYCKYLKEE